MICARTLPALASLEVAIADAEIGCSEPLDLPTLEQSAGGLYRAGCVHCEFIDYIADGVDELGWCQREKLVPVWLVGSRK
jgi:hypothetical protein